MRFGVRGVQESADDVVGCWDGEDGARGRAAPDYAAVFLGLVVVIVVIVFVLVVVFWKCRGSGAALAQLGLCLGHLAGGIEG